jgi:triosephosphate isomerase (TIM)
MPRKNIVAGNWKMNTTLSEGIELAANIVNGQRSANVQVILAVPYTHLTTLKKKVPAKSKILIAAQNCHHKTNGAFTGEISPTMLTDLKIPYVVIGHSERREYNSETNDILASKLKAALEQGLKVIFCCGEPLGIRKAGTHIAFVQSQLKESLTNIAKDIDMKNIVIAYEPIWAIGTGETASPEQAQDMHAAIRSFLNKTYGKKIADNTSILYGGSVKGSNAKEIFAKPDVDGGLVGGASLNADEFLQIINGF